MNNLLLILGIVIVMVVIVVVMLIWRHQSIQRARADMAERLERDLYTDNYFEEQSFELQSDPVFDEASAQTEQPTPPLEEKKSKTRKKKTELIIALYVVTQREPGFAGTKVLAILEELGLKYGHMKIFHHYGVGDIKVQQAVYSLANMVEPGTFNPRQMLDTTGLAFFMRLPGPFGGKVAFELMLNHAKRVAEVLDGTLEDDGYTLLNQRKITELRKRISHFEQRNTHL